MFSLLLELDSITTMGTGDWVADQRPMNWRQQILKLYPNGQAPLTAILSMLGSERVNDPQSN
jgi:hypothetical protein